MEVASSSTSPSVHTYGDVHDQPSPAHHQRLLPSPLSAEVREPRRDARKGAVVLLVHLFCPSPAHNEGGSRLGVGAHTEWDMCVLARRSDVSRRSHGQRSHLKDRTAERSRAPWARRTTPASLQTEGNRGLEEKYRGTVINQSNVFII